MKQATLNRERVEHLISRHYFDAKGFEWKNDGTTIFYHNGDASLIDVEVILAEHNALKQQVTYMQGKIDVMQEMWRGG